MIVVRDMHISPSLDDVLDRPLWQGPAARTEGFQQGIQRLLGTAQAKGMLQSRCVVGIFPVERCDSKRVLLQGGESVEISLPEETWRLCTHLAVSIATIGPQCESQATQFILNGERLNGLLLDAIGIATVELLEDRCRDLIREIASELVLKSGPTIHPGGVGFDIGQQSLLHRLLDAEQIGVSLSSSGVLNPVKSVSFVLPLGPDMLDCSQEHTCSRCKMSGTCKFRRHDQSQ